MTPKQREKIAEAYKVAKRPLYFVFDGIKYDLEMITVTHENGGSRSRRFLRIWGDNKTSAREKADAVMQELRVMGLPVSRTPNDARVDLMLREGKP